MRKVFTSGLRIVFDYLAPGRILHRNNNFRAATFASIVITVLDVAVLYFVFFGIPQNSTEVQFKLTTAVSYMLLRALLATALQFSPKRLLPATPAFCNENVLFLSVFLRAYPIFSLAIIISIHLFKLSAWGFFQGPSELSLPNIFPNDVIVIEHHYFKKNSARRGDLVVYERAGNFLISRIAAIPGDTVSIRNGALSVNGQTQNLQAMRTCIPVASKLYQAIEEENDAGKYTVLIGGCDVEISYRIGAVDVMTNEIVLVHDNRSRFGNMFSSLEKVPIDMSVFKVQASSLLHRPRFIHRSSSADRADIRLSE